jgi:hypothetical protein
LTVGCTLGAGSPLQSPIEYALANLLLGDALALIHESKRRRAGNDDGVALVEERMGMAVVMPVRLRCGKARARQREDGQERLHVASTVDAEIAYRNAEGPSKPWLRGDVAVVNWRMSLRAGESQRCWSTAG